MFVQERIIDIGVGEHPYFIRFRDHCDAEEYVGVDLDEKRLEFCRKSLEVPSVFRRPKRTAIVPANATNLPFEDGSFDLAVLSNVLSAPIHREWDMYVPEHKAKGFGLQDPFYLERKKVVAEALRVLRPGGVLRIYTDLIIYGLHSYNLILQELQDNRALSFEKLDQEQKRINELNFQKISSGDYCHCFLAELLPRASVYEVSKRG